MGRDALGHGHDPGEQGNPSHGKGGLFTAGGGDGGSSGGGHTSAGAKVAFAERAKLKSAKPEARVKVTKATKAAAGRGDHQRAQSHTGHGYPVSPHMGAHSVGTHQSGGGGGGGGGGGSGGGSGGGGGGTPRGQAKKEMIAKGKAVDARHYPGEPDSQVIQFNRGTNMPATKKAYPRGPSGRRH